MASFSAIVQTPVAKVANKARNTAVKAQKNVAVSVSSLRNSRAAVLGGSEQARLAGAVSRQQTASSNHRAAGLRTNAAAAAEVSTEAGKASREDVRNIAIIAHVDHGKTTLVDAMLAQSKVFRDNQKVEERIMDSNDIERERGITILSKNTAVSYKGKKINIIDTPGHADFGGEVERVLNMVDGVLLLVDSVEGPMPQTRFVLKKALELNKKVVLVVNKVDRDGARPEYVLDKTFDLFVDLGATDEQCDFPVIFASGMNGIAGPEPDELAENLEPMFEMIVNDVPPPFVNTDTDLQMLITNLDYDEHKGRIALGRVNAGKVTKQMSIKIATPDKDPRSGKIGELFIYENFIRTGVDEVMAGDICALSGLPDIGIGETIIFGAAEPLPTIEVEEPTVKVAFVVNTSPFAGNEGKFVTSRNIRDRLSKELERNLALKVEDGDTADTFLVSGRGSLHITILIENMRREGYEFCVGPPMVIIQNDPETGAKQEPYEEAVVEVGEQYTGAVVDMLSSRKGQMLDLNACDSRGQCVIKYKIPTRGLLGLRNALLTATRGTAVLNTVFLEYGEWSGDLKERDQGSLIAHETGAVTSYALFSAQERGNLFVKPGDEVYEGQIVGVHQRAGDLKVNVAKKKAATNVRSNKDATVVLNEAKTMSLDDCFEYIAADELMEITPASVRLLKNKKMDAKAMRR
ncbi:putative elongation factor TypA-like svr3, chloroplastic [Cymbomonas tetramitiformis]|uniref:Elongation factor TypA-like svr3, chloroplastic n=1 Tax=Cymbomonas tetramitiformis TaxID=36881 RepID=A0AAE0G764_9CHLO|nr:putative elongation factor TypA-like svr3, chloroplastic [Cymbomonas tetramitiformis]